MTDLPDLDPEMAERFSMLTQQQQSTFLDIMMNARDENSLIQEMLKHPDLLKAMNLQDLAD